MAELVFHRDGESRIRIPIDRDVVRLGSGHACDLVVHEDVAPETLCRFELTPGGWHLFNEADSGTRVDAATVEDSQPLTDGAAIQLDQGFVAIFHPGRPTTPGETRRAAADGATLADLRKAHARQRVRLRWQVGEDREDVLRLSKSPVGIGHDPSNAVVLQDEFASAFHARLVPGDDGWSIRDLGSTNGTHIGGVMVTEARLEPGALIRIGRTDLVLEEDRPPGNVPEHGILTMDPGMRLVLEQIDRVADSTATITLFGESGTGKELAARAVHLASPRHDGPYIPVNCAAISGELMESELFGHEKGSFTGATGARSGAFEEADGGTLFLDEVGELPLDLQAKLLRALELKEIRRVGASKPKHVDVRIVAATNRDLAAEVAAGRFREDLFYRLFVVPLTLPPLRRRKGDVLLLAEHFVRDRSMGPPPGFTEAARKHLLAHHWPGNIRELRNTIERALLLRRGELIDDEDLVFPPVPLTPAPTVANEAGALTLEEIIRRGIIGALRAHQGNRRDTAEALGIARSTLQTKLKELGIAEDEFLD